ncbi:L-serine kinase SbnI [Rubrobacter xylanophilus DSM 9941]|uniref:ParB N-terminal domain-containing protein n=1 Tax=Rubrobacter xylanophilus TaxID=49319 RepID=UPI001C63DC6C|nr:ParB N-terminal domain-containing protein [Rubrobacter xylanophilus]QYJ17210.1 L-serine kinase SbnI [Rubrobacter xylanophilus DSM 9941]
MIPALDALRIVALERLALHEDHDAARLERLRARMAAEGVQLNPVIVSPCEGRLLILDGAHRFRALEGLGCRLILVQVVRLPERVEGWQHLLRGLSPSLLRSDTSAFSVSEDSAPGALAEVLFPGEVPLRILSREDSLRGQVRALRALQALYPAGSPVRRVEPEGRIEPGEGEALVRYRPFSPGELLEVVAAGEVLPAGITRFRIPERVLGVRYPLEKLMVGDPEERTAGLRELARRRWEENRVRYYREPVILFE